MQNVAKNLARLTLITALALLPWTAVAETLPSPAAPPAGAAAVSVDPLPGELPVPDFLDDGCESMITCSGGSTISCTGGTGSVCTSTSSSVTCTSATSSCSVTCGPVNQYDACRDGCFSNYLSCRSSCLASCSTRTCYADCVDDCLTTLSACQNACGPAPPTSCSV